jgi:hypothetical protein
MSITDKLLGSTILRVLAVLFGVFSGAARLLDYIFPNPEIVRFFSTAGLLLVGLYFFLVVLERIIIRSEDLKAYLFLSERYGVGYLSLDVECTINPDGSAIVQRKVQVKAYSQIGELDNFMLLPENSPSGEKRNVNIVSVKSLTPGKNVTKTFKREFGRLSAEVSITPQLKPGEELTYTMIEELPPKLYAIGATKAELSLREDEFDYFGWNINRPTQQLTLKVFFPEKDAPDFYRTQVRYASVSGFPSNRLQPNEEKRIHDPRGESESKNQYSLNIDVNYPMLGLIYILRWRPKVKEDVLVRDEIPAKIDPKQAYHAAIRRILIDKFSEGELRTLATDLGVDYDNLPDSGKANKARELVLFLDRRDQLSQLVQVGKHLRPTVEWPIAPS